MHSFQVAEIQRRAVLLGICLIFCQFQPGVAYKSVAYKKTCNRRALTDIRIHP